LLSMWKNSEILTNQLLHKTLQMWHMGISRVVVRSFKIMSLDNAC
jgi:hypothetical protein